MSGSFEFAFVPPGQHQVTIDNSSIPRGFTASNPVQTITVQGGQAATASFYIGTFGGILGHVYGTDPSGNPMPLSNVQLRVDGGTYAQTDNSGAFGFGGLSAGQHVVTVIPQSIPASADFAPSALVQKVTVSDGRYATLDFRAQLLGSIAGSIVYAKDMGKQAGLGVINAYVVAEPGDYAAIDEEDGSFIMDNLPAGDYTLSVDPETIPPRTRRLARHGNRALGSGRALQRHSVPRRAVRKEGGLLAALGLWRRRTGSIAADDPRERDASTPAWNHHRCDQRAGRRAGRFRHGVWQARRRLRMTKEVEKWLGEIEVPDSRTARVNIRSTAASTGRRFHRTQSLPWIRSCRWPSCSFCRTPTLVGQVATVRARFLVDVHEGDKITWDDGTPNRAWQTR